jgi:hypothetical protein
LDSSDFASKKSLAPAVAAPTVGDESIKQQLLALLSGGTDSSVAIAVGSAEGTRTPDGKKTAAWHGHKDPGNGAQKQGSFSYQHSAATPNDADLQQIQKFKDILLPKFVEIIPRLQQWEIDEIKMLLLYACDVYTQSETACLAKGGFLEQVAANGNSTPTISVVIDWRVQAYYVPKTGKLDAPGFGNDLTRLVGDQTRRCEAIISSAEKLGIF